MIDLANERGIALDAAMLVAAISHTVGRLVIVTPDFALSNYFGHLLTNETILLDYCRDLSLDVDKDSLKINYSGRSAVDLCVHSAGDLDYVLSTGTVAVVTARVSHLPPGQGLSDLTLDLILQSLRRFSKDVRLLIVDPFNQFSGIDSKLLSLRPSISSCLVRNSIAENHLKTVAQPQHSVVGYSSSGVCFIIGRNQKKLRNQLAELAEVLDSLGIVKNHVPSPWQLTYQDFGKYVTSESTVCFIILDRIKSSLTWLQLLKVAERFGQPIERYADRMTKDEMVQTLSMRRSYVSLILPTNVDFATQFKAGVGVSSEADTRAKRQYIPFVLSH